MLLIGQKKLLWSAKLKRQLHGIVEKMVWTFYEKELQRTNQEEFRIEKVIKRKGNKLYVKWKGYDNSFNSLIDKNDIV